MIVKLGKDRASTEGTEDMSDYIFYYLENGFGILPYRREKVKFFTSDTSDKDLNFLDTLEFYERSNWDVLHWNKE